MVAIVTYLQRLARPGRWAGSLLAALGLVACAALPQAAPGGQATQPAAQERTGATQPVTTAAAQAVTTAVPPVTTDAALPGQRGAHVPWVEYEAEDGTTTGTVLTATRSFGEIAAEASGRRAVKLSASGQYVQIKTTSPANSIVVRYAIPDAPNGGGITATLSLYINGTFRQKLRLTSRYAWSYGGETGSFKTPVAGGAHHFFDEMRALTGMIPAGATIKLQKDADDHADYYVIDLIDLEQVAPPRTMPANFLSLTDCGARPNDGSESGQAIQSCINQARAQHKGVWIPPGTFESNRQLQSSLGITVADVTIQGAGMWYSTIHGSFARFYCTGNNCRFADFAILGETTLRDDNTPDNGFNGGAGTGSRLDR